MFILCECAQFGSYSCNFCNLVVMANNCEESAVHITLSSCITSPAKSTKILNKTYSTNGDVVAAGQQITCNMMWATLHLYRNVSRVKTTSGNAHDRICSVHPEFTND